MSFVLTVSYPGDAAQSNVHFAAGLAQTLGLPLQVLLSYTVPLAVGEMPMPLLPVEEVRDAAQNRLDALQNDLQTRYTGLQIQTNLKYGTTQDALQEAAGSGTQGAAVTVLSIGDAAQTDAWFGTDSVNIMRENQGLVLAVPQGVSYHSPRHICLACDAKGIQDGLPISGLLNLRSKLPFRLTILHVLEEGTSSTSYDRSLLQEQLAGSAASFSEITASSAVDEAIVTFAQAQSVDWLALSPRHHGFWDSLFHRSHTSRLLSHTRIPVLAIHK
ncbi:MAG: universal stress protein [Bacteroidetes bacterium]|nr:universal stress protein [Bacteroidota bacterium]